MTLTSTLTPQQLLWKARRYMRDATNATCSTHTRYAAAMSALTCLCLAGVGDDHDAILVDLFEASRHDVDAWPTAQQVAVVVAHVSSLLPNEAQR